MEDYKRTLTAHLNTILPTYYENFSDEEIQTPCITYSESSNYAQEEGDTLRYSLLSYQVKIWGDGFEALAPYAQELDKLLFGLGFKRTSYNELYFGTKLCMIFTYEAKAIENYGG